MTIPTEPIGSIPRPRHLIDAVVRRHGDIDAPELEPIFEDAIRDTITRFEATGSPVITDGEQRKYHGAWDYCVHGLPNVVPDGFKVPCTAGLMQRMPRLIEAPFRYAHHADHDLEVAKRYARAPLKQTVISPCALSLLYPVDGIAGYSREQFIDDLLAEHVGEIRRCLQKGAHSVQIDFTEGRLAIELDPTGTLLASFLVLANLALARLSTEERKQLGVHNCSGRGPSSPHRTDLYCGVLLPSVLQLDLTNFYVSLADETDRKRVLRVIRDNLKPGQRLFVGVVSPLDPRIETPEEVCARVLEAADYIPVEQLGTTDDCGFSPSTDDASTTRDITFAKIAARVRGTELAARTLRAS